jgi:hypothetical protein
VLHPLRPYHQVTIPRAARHHHPYPRCQKHQAMMDSSPIFAVVPDSRKSPTARRKTEAPRLCQAASRAVLGRLVLVPRVVVGRMVGWQARWRVRLRHARLRLAIVVRFLSTYDA